MNCFVKLMIARVLEKNVDCAAFFLRPTKSESPSAHHLVFGCLRISFKLILLMISCLAISSCGYQFGYGNRSLPDGVKSVHIPIFENETYQTGAEVPFTNALIAEIHDSNVARISNAKNAEAVLKGRVIRIDFEQANIDSRRRDEDTKTSGIENLPRGTVIITEYLARVTLEVQMFKKGKLIWKQWLRDERLYDAPQLGLEVINTANASYNRTAREAVVKDLARVMMHELYGRLTENF